MHNCHEYVKFVDIFIFYLFSLFAIAISDMSGSSTKNVESFIQVNNINDYKHWGIKHQVVENWVFTFYIYFHFYLHFFVLFSFVALKQLTCDSVYQTCKDDSVCAGALRPVITSCDFHTCNRNACLDALQQFYRYSNEDFTLDIAFCVCKYVQKYSFSSLIYDWSDNLIN